MGLLKNEQGRTRGEEESKLRNLEQTYFLNVPIPFFPFHALPSPFRFGPASCRPFLELADSVPFIQYTSRKSNFDINPFKKYW